MGGGLQGEILGAQWAEITRSWYKISREIQTRLITYKIIHRLYWTPCKMARLKLCESELCWRCERSRGTLLHMLYECEKTQNLWEQIILLINKVFGVELSQGPALCILGIITEDVELSPQQTLWCRLALTTGCRIALRHWKSQNTLQFNEWLDEINKIANYERLIFKLNNKEEIFTEIWGPYLRLVKDG